MSIVSTRPRVKSVVNSRTIDTARTVAHLLNQCAPATTSFARQALNLAQTPTLVNTVQAVTSLLVGLQARRDQKLKTIKQSATVTDLEARKLSLVAAIAEGPWLLDDSQALHAPLLALQSSRTLSQTLKAQEQLLRTIVVGHNKVLTRSLAVACTNAFRKTGFRSIEALPGSDHTVRFAATNRQGQTLVTEIHADPLREPNISTEVVSGCDSQTPAILDAFDKALEEEGVRAGAPVRRGTGGICQLSSAIEFTKRKLSPKQTTQQKSGPLVCSADQSAIKRSQRLNNCRALARNRD